MSVVVAFWNIKGGVAKTTSVSHVADRLVQDGKTVLCLDLDTGNLTQTLFPNEDFFPALSDALEGQIALHQIIQKVREKWYLAPARLKAGDTKTLSYQYLRSLLKPYQDFDYILLDCPATVNDVSINALAASRYVFLPCQPLCYSLNGLQNALEFIEQVQQSYNKSLEVGGIFFTQVSRKSSALSKAKTLVAQNYPHSWLMKECIHLDETLLHFPLFGRTAFDMKDSSGAQKDYQQLSEAIKLRCTNLPPSRIPLSQVLSSSSSSRSA